MRVTVADIPERGLAIQAGAGDVWAVRAATLALEARPVALTASLRLDLPRPGVVRVSGTASAAADRVCDRCAEPVALAITAPVDLVYVPEGAEAPVEDQEVELGAADLDLGTYAGGVLDVEAVLAEALALALPARVVCDDVPACDARTAALLATAGDRAPTALGSALAGLGAISNTRHG